MPRRFFELFGRRGFLILTLIVLAGPVVWLDLDERLGVFNMCLGIALGGFGTILRTQRNERRSGRKAGYSLGAMMLAVSALGMTAAIRAFILGVPL